MTGGYYRCESLLVQPKGLSLIVGPIEISRMSVAMDN